MFTLLSTLNIFFILIKTLGTTVSIYPSADAFPYMVKRDGWCNQGLSNYCYARKPLNVLDLVESIQKRVLDSLMDLDRLKRAKTISWYQKSVASTGLMLPDIFDSVTVALWGAELAASTKAQDTTKWSMQMYWIDMLLTLANSDEVPKDIAMLANGQIFKILASVQTAMATTGIENDLRYPLLRSLIVKLQAYRYLVA